MITDEINIIVKNVFKDYTLIYDIKFKGEE